MSGAPQQQQRHQHHHHHNQQQQPNASTRPGEFISHPWGIHHQGAMQERPHQVSHQQEQDWGMLASDMPLPQAQAVRPEFDQHYNHYLHANTGNNAAAAAAAAAVAASTSSHTSMLSSPVSWNNDSQSEVEGASYSRSALPASGITGRMPTHGRHTVHAVPTSKLPPEIGTSGRTEHFEVSRGQFTAAASQPSQIHWSGPPQNSSRESLWHMEQQLHHPQRQRYESDNEEHAHLGGTGGHSNGTSASADALTWFRSGDDSTSGSDYSQGIPQQAEFADSAGDTRLAADGQHLRAGQPPWSQLQGQDHQTRLHQQQTPSMAMQTSRQHHSGLALPHHLYQASERSAAQPMAAYSESTLPHQSRLFGESSSESPHPSLQVADLLPGGQHHLQQDGPLSLNGIADDRIPWTAPLRNGVSETYPQGNIRVQYDNENGSSGAHPAGPILSAQAALSEYASTAPSSSHSSDPRSGSILSQAFTSNPSPAMSNRSAPLHQASAVTTAYSLANAAHPRQRASTLSAAALEARNAMPAHRRPPVAMQRSLSTDGMTAPSLEQNSFAVRSSEYAPSARAIVTGTGGHGHNAATLHLQNGSPHMGGRGPMSPFAQQTPTFSGAPSYSSDPWDYEQHNDFGINRYQHGERQGSTVLGVAKDSDSARLSLALAKTQLNSSSSTSELPPGKQDQIYEQRSQQGQGQHYDLSHTIIEEEEDYGGDVDLSRRQFPEHANMQPPGGSREIPKLEVQYRESGDLSSDSPSVEYPGTFAQQPREESFRSDLPQAILQPLTQHYQQQHSFGSIGAASPSVQRRYRPLLRPSTYQQLNIMDFEDSNTEGSLGESYSSNHIGERATLDSFMDTAIRHYITSASRLGLGERTVLIMTSKVAQKSYGAEKRFLCPPPMVLLIGSSWWSVCQDSDMIGMRPQQGLPGPPTILTPPRVNIGMSGETNNHDGVLEWATSSGRLIDVGNPSSEMAVSGRCIGKQLYITDADEKRRSCETLVSVSVSGLNANDPRLLGTFASKSIKIISKPSKKRQSNRNAELGIVHGSIVSLFHRLRSQTVSTRYLCVSGAPSWFKGSDGQPFLTLNHRKVPSSNRNDQPSCFVAKMTSWDPFVVYLIDPKKSSVADPSVPPMKPPVMGYPSPPPNALEVPPSGQHPLQIHYNQRIVLQCLNTAAVSPVMVIRKVDKATTVVGGIATSSSSPTTEEALGDPVSQLHKIALEVVDDSTPPAPVAALNGLGGPSSPPGPSGAFLACLNESVGMRRPLEPRRWLWPLPREGNSGNGNSAGSPAMVSSSASEQHQSATTLAAAYAAAATRGSLAQGRYPSDGSGIPATTTTTPSSRLSFSAGSAAASGSPYIVPASQQQQLQHEQQLAEGSSDGGKVRRPRRVSSSVTSPMLQQQRSGSLSGPSPTLAPAPKGRRRGQSLSILEWQRAQAKQAHGGGSDPSLTLSPSDSILGDIPLGAAWSAEVADSDIWTIVGTDIARHTFYVPPRVVGGVRPPSSNPDSGIAHLITTPAPSVPITPIPILHSFIPPSTPNLLGSETAGGPSSLSTTTASVGNNHPPSPERLVTLLGERLSDELHVYFGDWRSTYVQVQSSETLLCAPPPSASEAFHVPSIRLPILFVRKDGVIFPTECIYSV